MPVPQRWPCLAPDLQGSDPARRGVIASFGILRVRVAVGKRFGKCLQSIRRAALQGKAHSDRGCRRRDSARASATVFCTLERAARQTQTVGLIAKRLTHLGAAEISTLAHLGNSIFSLRCAQPKL